MPAIFGTRNKRRLTATPTSRCIYWNWKGCKVKKTAKRRRGGAIRKLIGGVLSKNMAKLRKAKLPKRRYKKKRKGKLSNWVKGALAAVAPSAAAIGYGTIKHLLKKNTGYTDIYS